MEQHVFLSENTRRLERIFRKRIWGNVLPLAEMLGSNNDVFPYRIQMQQVLLDVSLPRLYIVVAPTVY
jgi:hypothetical protein